ncbi:uncharacterized protein [Drosophila tropicalis]|uniref:uncharacterized protein n=1 Tax=Drosophila tropicalis TaxID=46794 RepID=UPI0035AB7D53
MSPCKYKTFLCPAVILILCLQNLSLAAPVPHYNDDIITEEVTYPTSPNEVLPIEPLLIYPKPQEYYQARTLGGSGEGDIIFVKLLQDKSKGYRPKQQRIMEEQSLVPRKELGLKDIFYVKAHTNGRFSHERLKVYRVPEFYAISVFRNGEK